VEVAAGASVPYRSCALLCVHRHFCSSFDRGVWTHCLLGGMTASADDSAIPSVYPTDPVAFACWLHWLGLAFGGGLCRTCIILASL
jgi:hypothetical protein